MRKFYQQAYFESATPQEIRKFGDNMKKESKLAEDHSKATGRRHRYAAIGREFSDIAWNQNGLHIDRGHAKYTEKIFLDPKLSGTGDKPQDLYHKCIWKSVDNVTHLSSSIPHSQARLDTDDSSKKIGYNSTLRANSAEMVSYYGDTFTAKPAQWGDMWDCAGCGLRIQCLHGSFCNACILRRSNALAGRPNTGLEFRANLPPVDATNPHRKCMECKSCYPYHSIGCQTKTWI